MATQASPTPLPSTTPTSQPSPSPLPVTITPTAIAPLTQRGEFPDSAGYQWQPMAGGLNRPVGLANAGDGSQRLFVLEQPGVIRIVREETVMPDPFLDISSQVVAAASVVCWGWPFTRITNRMAFSTSITPT